AHLGRALPLEDRSRPAGEDRQPREEDAGRLHPQGRLRHHRRRPPLPRAPHPRRGATALRPRRAAEVRGAEERAGGEEAGGFRALTTGARIDPRRNLSAAERTTRKNARRVRTGYGQASPSTLRAAAYIGIAGSLPAAAVSMASSR